MEKLVTLQNENTHNMKKATMVTLFVLIALVVAGGIIVFHPAFGRSPRGERLERIKQSPYYSNGSFHNLQLTPTMTFDKGFVRVMWDFLTKKGSEETVPDHELNAVKTDLHNLDLTKNQLIWFGHSSYLMVIDGKKILVDPVLTSSFPSSLTMKPFKGTDIYSPKDIPDVDILVITHDHYDHLDYGTVKDIKNRVGKIICPLGVGEHLELWGVPADRIYELDWYEAVHPDEGLKVTALPSRHFSGRFMKRNTTLWASFMLETPEGVIFIGGDGGYGRHFAEIADRYPEIDLAILENGQYDKDWSYIHTLPSEQREIIHTLRPKEVLSVHNSKFKLANHRWDEPMREMDSLSASDHSFRLLRPKIGEISYLELGHTQELP